MLLREERKAKQADTDMIGDDSAEFPVRCLPEANASPVAGQFEFISGCRAYGTGRTMKRRRGLLLERVELSQVD